MLEEFLLGSRIKCFEIIIPQPILVGLTLLENVQPILHPQHRKHLQEPQLLHLWHFLIHSQGGGSTLQQGQVA